MDNKNIENFFKACDELIECKYLVAEYKLQKMLQALANAEEICSLVGECLEQFNRDREFAKAFVQDGQGEFMVMLPNEEYKVIALVFCTLVDIDAKKIDFTDFVKRFFGRDENPYGQFIKTMVLPFKNLISEAFGYGEVSTPVQEETAIEDEEEIDEEDDEIENDEFERAQKIAVQILSQLEYARKENCNLIAMQICRAIVKTTPLRDREVTASLVYALKESKAKQVKFLIKELVELFD